MIPSKDATPSATREALERHRERHHEDCNARRAERDAAEARERAKTPEQRSADRAAAERAEVAKIERSIDEAQRAQLARMRENYGLKR